MSRPLGVPTRAHPLVRALWAEARQQKVSLGTLAERSGLNASTITKWRGTYNPGLANYVAVLNSLGLDLAIVPREGG